MRLTLIPIALAIVMTGPMRTEAQAPKLKVHISVDMEGVAGAVTGDQLGPTGFEYGRFREFMTREAVAAVTAAREAGATEIVVADSHGNGENLLIEQFPADVRVVRSWPRKLSMMAGVDETVDAAMFIGYHASHQQHHRRARAHVLERDAHPRGAERRRDDRRVVERRHRRSVQRARHHDVGRRCGDCGGEEGGRQHRRGRDEEEPRVPFGADDHAPGVGRVDRAAGEGRDLAAVGVQAVPRRRAR